MSDITTAAPSGDGVEIEWQFDALDLRPVERWLADLPGQPGTAGGVGDSNRAPIALAKPPRRLVDTYLDTADWRIGRAGFVLRTRNRGQSDEATLKDTRPAGAGGLRRRLEVTEILPEGGVAALGTSGPVGRRLAAVAGRRPFHQVLEVRTRRRPYSLQVDGNEVAEVALDDTVITIGAGQQPVRLCRVEVESAPDWVGALGPLVDDLRRSCGLQPALLSKFEAGLLALGVQVPGPPDLGSTEVTPTTSLGDLAFAVVRTQLGVLLAREPGTRLGEDIEELHDMRVATRRLRAALDFFADALPARAVNLRAELTWLAAVLGRVRDLDVQIERLGEMEQWAAAPRPSGGSPLEELRRLLEEERGAARRGLLGALDSARWESLADGLVALAQHGQQRWTATARGPAAVALPDLVTPRHRAVVKAARRARRSGAVDDFHRLRIRCKRLRYSLEFTAGVYDGRPERFTRKLAKLQDVLGALQDADVATNRLLDLATAAGGSGGRLPPRTVFAMGAVAERYRAESAQLARQLPGQLAVLDGGAWRDLAAHMTRRRQEATEAAPAGPARTDAGPPLPEAVPTGLTTAPSGPAAAGADPDTEEDEIGEAEPGAAETVRSDAAQPPDGPPDNGPPDPGPSRPATGSPDPVPPALTATTGGWPEVAWGLPTSGPGTPAPALPDEDDRPMSTPGRNGDVRSTGPSAPPDNRAHWPGGE